MFTNALSAVFPPFMKRSKLWDNSAFPVKVPSDLPLSLGVIGHALVSCDMKLNRGFAKGAAAHARKMRPYRPPSHKTSRRWTPRSPQKGSMFESKIKCLLSDNGSRRMEPWRMPFFFTWAVLDSEKMNCSCKLRAASLNPRVGRGQGTQSPFLPSHSKVLRTSLMLLVCKGCVKVKIHYH